MNHWIKELFHGPIKNEESFWLLKSYASIKNFIESFEYKSTIEEQIMILNQLFKILSNKKSIINICIFNKFNDNKITNDNIYENEKSVKISSINLKNENPNFIDWLIKEYFLYKNEKISKSILNLLSLFIKVVGVKKSYLQYIYLKISDYYFYSSKKYFIEEDKININNDISNFTRYLNLLLLMYGNNNEINKPYNFYFFGNDTFMKMEPPIKKSNSLYLKDGITIFSCFNCLYSPKYSNQKYSIIFSIEFNKEIYYSLLIDKDMNLILCLSNENINIINNYEINKKLIVTKIISNNWINIMISLNIKKNKNCLIEIKINSIESRTFEIENNNYLEKIENIILYKNFIGLSTSFLLFNSYIDIKNNNFINDFPYGLYKISQLNKFFNKQILYNILSNLIILIIPFEIKLNTIYNFANFNHTYLSDELLFVLDNIKIKMIRNDDNDNLNELCPLTGVNINKRLDKNILLLGGINNLFPLFEILLSINKKIFDTKNFIYLNIFQKSTLSLMQIVEVIIFKNIKNNIKKIIKFFKILSLFLEKIIVTGDIEGTIFNDKLINIFKNIGNILLNNNYTKKKEICKIFFNNIVLNINFIKKLNISQHIKIFQYLYQCITNNNFFDLDYKNIISIIKYFDNIYQNNYCCKEHFLFIKEITKIETNISYNKMLNNLLDINTKLLSYIIKNESDAYIDLLNLLIGKNSPCFIELVIKNIFLQNLNFENKEITNLKKNLVYLLKNNILYILLYLLSIYFYPNIIKLIIELLFNIQYLSNLFGISLTKFFNNLNIINYISNSIYPIHLKIKGEYISKSNINKDFNDKLSHFFSSDVLPIIVNEDESFNDSFSNIKKSGTFYKYSSRNIIENNSKNLLKYNKSLNNNINHFERKRVLSNTIKYNSRKSNNSIIPNKSLSNNNLINLNQKEIINSSFEKENKPLKNRKCEKHFSRKLSNNFIPKIDKINNDLSLLSKFEYDRKFIFKRIILDCLLNWLNKNPRKYIFEIITKYIKNINYEYINLDKFIDSFNKILNRCSKEEIYNLNDLIDHKTFIWFFEITYQFYLLKSNNYSILPFEENKNDLINNIIINGTNLIINIFLYNINNNKYNDMIEDLNYIMQFSKQIKKKYPEQNNNNTLKTFYKKLFLDLLNISRNIILFLIQNNDNSDSSSESGFYVDDEKENIILYIINICYEYVFFNNIENNYIEINNFLKSKNDKIFNNVLLSDISVNTDLENDKKNINNNNNIIEEENINITKYLSDYEIIEKMNLIIKPFIYLNTTSNNYEDKKYLTENILNIKNSNRFFTILNIMCRDNILYLNNSIKMLPFIYIISNLYIFSLNLSKNKKELFDTLNNYKSFIIFLILSSSNLSDNEGDKEIIEIINSIQSKITTAINYYIYYLYDKYKTNDEIIENYLVDIFRLMIKIMNNIYLQNKKKNSIFIKDSKENKICKCAVHKIFLSEVMVKYLSKEKISLLIKNKFKEFKNIKSFIDFCSNIFVDSELRHELKNIFYIDTMIKKYLDKIDNFEIYINFKKEKFNNDIKIKEKINEKMKNTINLLNENNNNYMEKIYIKKLKYKNKYKTIKKLLFGYNGFWRNPKIFENNSNNGESFKYKLINHYNKSFCRNLFAPIFDLENYLSQYPFINKNTIFEQNKNISNVNNINLFRKNIICLDFKKLFIDIVNETEQKYHSNYNNIHYCLIEEIRNNNFPEINNLINDISNNNLFNTNNKIKKSYIINSSYSCCYIKPDTHIKGYLSMKNKKMKFIMDIYNNINKLNEDDLDREKGCCYGSFIKYKNNNKFIYFNIKYSSIKFLFLRKYYYKDSSLEIFTTKNKCYYINFSNPKIRKYIIDMILIHFGSKQEIKTKDNKILGYYLNNNNANYFINDIDSDFYKTISYELDSIIKKWKYWEITTFDFLMYLNIYSNRSFQDLTQYPVFPWLLTQYNDFTSSLDKKESKNEITNNDSENEEAHNINILNLIKGNMNCINMSSVKSSSEVSKDNNNSITEKEENNNIKIFGIIKDIRDFSLPMGMLTLNEEGRKRKKYYLKKYNSKMEKSSEALDNENYIYDSHYSNPKYISGYLIRIFPFININIELNGKKFINEGNILFSLDETFKNASTKKGDLRELCPDFFFLPEMFININYFALKRQENYGNEIKNGNFSIDNYIYEQNLNSNLKRSLKHKKLNNKKDLNYNNNNQNGFLIDDINEFNNFNNVPNNVQLPKWGENNPYLFVSKMKKFLESDNIGNNINKWLDLIFGYNQKGENSRLNNNLFPSWTYDSFDIRKNQNGKNKSFYYKLVEQGMTPHQLLNRPFPSRLMKPEDDLSISLIKNKLKYNSFKNKKKINLEIKRKVLKMKFFDEENIICVFNYYQFAIFDLIKYALIVDVKIEYNYKYYLTKELINKYNYLLIQDLQIISLNSPIIIYSQGRFIAQGGFFGGLIIISEIDLDIDDKIKDPFSSLLNTTEIFNKVDYSPIVSLNINKSEDVIMGGTYLGTIIIYDNSWNIKDIINDHQHLPITSLNFSDELQIWGSTCMDGLVKIYTYPTNKPILSLKVEQSSLYADYLMISSSPLPCIIFFCKKNLYFYAYSLLGKLIVKEKEEYINIKSPLIFKDNYGNDILLYGDDIGSINIRFLPSLELANPFEINENSINIIEMSNNSRYCCGWSDEEEELYIIFDPYFID